MIRVGASALLALTLLFAAPVAGQGTQTRRAVRPGEVTGLEMGIEGSLVAAPGARVRWFVTLYEVVRRRDLRPAPDATLEVTASFSRGELLSTVQTDATGHAAIEIPIPDESPGHASVRVRAVSPRGVERVFSVGLELVRPHVIELYADRDRAPPGARVAAVGRVLDRATGRPVAGVEVRLSLQRGEAVLGAVRPLITDARGVFATTDLELPEAPGGLQLRARTDEGDAQRELYVVAPARPPTWVVTEVPPLARPGEVVPVGVHVRTIDGEPIAGARLQWSDAPADEDDEAPPTTDAEGRARIEWEIPAAQSDPWQALSRTLTVTDPAHGSVSHPVHLRVARVPALVAWAVDGGALVPGLGGRIYVRVVRPDGTPYVGPLQLEAPRLGGALNAMSDADGVAVFDGPVAAEGDASACGGSTATEVFAVVGEHRERLCLPLEPDATLRVADASVTDERLAVEVDRAAAVRAAAVEVTVLGRVGEGWAPLARGHVAPGERALSLALPNEARGELWVRARPIVGDGLPVRGGSRLVFRGARRALALEAGEAAGRVDADGDATVALFAGRGLSLRDAIHRRYGAVFAAREEGRGARFVAALLASRTPHDAAASAALREGDEVAQPMPMDPVSQGLLRDPWRSRARFIRGRVGRLMRAVEDYVDSRIPDDREEVAIRERGRWRFNHSVLEGAVAAAQLDQETATGLDGEPLDIDALQALDASFTYDRVARRITRRRLWTVLVQLRELVRERGLDRPWARRGDPSAMTQALVELGSELGLPYAPSRGELFDGWGQPFVLRPVRGRARFDFLEPVEGYELVSPGPDGRPGTGDDVVDPFARVLPSSGIYAEAVGEDVLLARLSGVALGRATLESLAEVFAEPTPQIDWTAPTRAHATWGSLPAPTEAPDALPPAVAPLEAPIGGLGATPSWSVGGARRRYEAVAVRFDADGALATESERFVAGAPWVARVELPRVLRPGDALRVPVHLVRLDEASPPTIEASVRGSGVDASIEGRQLFLRATDPGIATVEVTVRAGERVVSRFAERVRVVPEGLLRERARAVLVDGEATLSVAAPDDARPWRSVVTVGAPRALGDAPSLAPTRETSAGLFAWARAMAGRPADPELLAAATAADDPLGRACALVAWAADPDYLDRVDGVAGAIAEGLPEDDLAARAAVLAALAPSAPATPGGGDPTASLVTALREDGWRALATASDDPAVMARMAAALLLADRDDSRGRALLERARAALEEDDHGRRWVPGSPDRAGDGWIGTLALAVAARQVDAHALADELGRVALTRLYLADRTGPDGAFWALAASVYGVFGVEAPAEVTLRVDGVATAVDLSDGVATRATRDGASVEVRSDAPVWARVRSRYIVPIEQAEDGALRVSLEGVPGRAGQRAGFELVAHNASGVTVGAPVVEVVLPGAARLDDEARAAIARQDTVVSVGPVDGANVVRLRLAPLAADADARVTLPWRWIAAGRVAGPSLVAYDASQPWRMTVRPGEALSIEESP